MAVFPRIALAERNGLDEAGHFILLGYLFIPAILAQAALQQMVAPRLAEASAIGDRAGLFHLVVRLSVLQFILQMVIAIAVFLTQQAIGFSWLASGFSLATSDLVWFALSQCTAVALNSIGLVMDADGRYREKLFFWSALTVTGVVLTWWLATQGIVGVSKAAVIVGIGGGIFAAIWFRRSLSPKVSARGIFP